MYIKRYISEDVATNVSTSAFRFMSSDLNLSNQKGEIFALITLSGEKQFNAERAAKFVWDGIVDEYMGGRSGSVIEDVKASLTAGSKKLLELMKNDETVSKSGVDLSFALCIFRDKNAYLGIFGEQEIALFKNHDFVYVSEILNENKSAAASIALAQDDCVILSSPRLMEGYLSSFTDIENITALVAEFNRRESVLEKGSGVMLISQTELEQRVIVPEEREEMEPKEDDNETETEEKEVAEDGSESKEEETSEKEEPKEEEGPEAENDIEIKGQVNGEGKKGFVDQAKEKLAVVKAKASPVMNRIGVFFSKIGGKVRSVADDKYGRKIWYKRILSRISSMKFAERRGVQGMRVDGYKISGVRNKRVSLVVIAAAIIAVIFIGAKLSIRAREARELHDLAVTVSEKVVDYLDSAETNLQSNKNNAQTSLFNAQQELDKLDGKELSLDDAKSVKELKSRMQTLDDRLNKRVVLSESDKNIESFLDTSLEFDSSSSPTDIAIQKDEFQNEYLYITDAGAKAVFKVNTYDGSVSKMSDGNGVLVSPRYVDIGVQGIYVYDSSIGVVKSAFDNAGGSTDFVGLTGLGVEDLGGNDVNEMAIFTQEDNVYLLSKSANAVLKSNRTASGYGLPYTYISSDSFSTASDFYGDISIYVLTAGAKGLERYTYSYETGKTNLTPVDIVGLTPEFESLTAGYTGATLDTSLYVYDGSSNRFISFEKPREAAGDALHPNEMWLLNQYVYRGERDDVFKNVKDFVVDFQEANAYVLDGTRVWKIKLK